MYLYLYVNSPVCSNGLLSIFMPQALLWFNDFTGSAQAKEEAPSLNSSFQFSRIYLPSGLLFRIKIILSSVKQNQTETWLELWFDWWRACVSTLGGLTGYRSWHRAERWHIFLPLQHEEVEPSKGFGSHSAHVWIPTLAPYVILGRLLNPSILSFPDYAMGIITTSIW